MRLMADQGFSPPSLVRRIECSVDEKMERDRSWDTPLVNWKGDGLGAWRTRWWVLSDGDIVSNKVIYRELFGFDVLDRVPNAESRALDNSLS